MADGMCSLGPFRERPWELHRSVTVIFQNGGRTVAGQLGWLKGNSQAQEGRERLAKAAGMVSSQARLPSWPKPEGTTSRQPPSRALGPCHRSSGDWEDSGA